MTICHGAGQDDTTQFVTLTLSTNAVYQDQGNSGHFYEMVLQLVTIILVPA
jgi:hypothetical protein